MDIRGLDQAFEKPGAYVSSSSDAFHPTYREASYQLLLRHVDAGESSASELLLSINQPATASMIPAGRGASLIKGPRSAIDSFCFDLLPTSHSSLSTF